MVGGVDVARWYRLWMWIWCRATGVRNVLIDVWKDARSMPM